jgi:DNA-binding MarR family transcriptional regulator
MKAPNYEKIKEIITQWELFEQSNTEPELKQFALWLYQQESEHELAQETINSRFRQEIRRTAIPTQRSLSIEEKMATLINRLSRFLRMYAKKALAGLAVSSLDEYLFLLTTARIENPSKTELIQNALLEVTTGSDIIKRMINADLFEEFPDQQDKRLKRVCLTSKGKEVLQEATLRMNQVVSLTNANTSESHQQQLLAMLAYLDHFHTQIYQQENETQLETLLRKYVMANG